MTQQKQLDIMYTRGLPGSGKTTWARKFLAENPGYKRVNNDELRLMLDGEQFNPKNEDYIRVARKALITGALSNHKSVLVDNCNLSPKAVAELEGFAKAFNATLTEEDFTSVSVSECLANDAKRASPVGRRVIKRMRDQFLREKEVVYKRDRSLPTAILVDMDGTLALHGGRDVYDFSRLGEDALNEPVACVVNAAYELGVMVIVMTAREAKFEQLTQDWLTDHGVLYSDIFTRANGDKREDSIVKRELFEQHIAGKYDIQYVLDDRDRVVRMWREQLGLTVFQVADGDF